MSKKYDLTDESQKYWRKIYADLAEYLEKEKGLDTTTIGTVIKGIQEYILYGRSAKGPQPMWGSP